MNASDSLNRRFPTQQLCLIVMGALINFAGSSLALVLRIPIYMNSIGTILCAALLGPAGGILSGVIGAFLCGVTSDIYSLYYLPVQILAGAAAGLIFRRFPLRKMHSLPLLLWSVLISLPVSVSSACITAFVFQGITSSGSTLLVQVLHGFLGIDLVVSCFLIQMLTDFANILCSVVLVRVLFSALPASLTASFSVKKRKESHGPLQSHHQ